MSEKINGLIKLLNKINVVSIDDGKRFTNLTRINNIYESLKDSNYNLFYKGRLSYLWKHNDFDEKHPVILISCHADSIYNNHFSQIKDEVSLLGTFDNSINNAILVLLMLNNLLHPNVLISFTGDEENNSKGAKETSKTLINDFYSIWENLEIVISLDVTGEGYDKFNFSIENWFVKKESIKKSEIFFEKKKIFKKYLRTIFDEKEYKILFISDNDDRAAEDESWEYDEFDLNCFSLCLPTIFHPDNASLPQEDWMHDDKGILIQTESINCFIEAIPYLTEKIINDFSRK